MVALVEYSSALKYGRGVCCSAGPGDFCNSLFTRLSTSRCNFSSWAVVRPTARLPVPGSDRVLCLLLYEKSDSL